MIATHLVTRHSERPALPEGLPSSLGEVALQVGICATALPIALLLLKPARAIEKDELLERGCRSCSTLIVLDTPGRILGTWKSEGVKHGGADDSLVFVTVIGPDHQPIQAYDHESEGTFDLKVKMPGTYSVVFDNVGIIRATSRSVHASFRFAPDSPLSW